FPVVRDAVAKLVDPAALRWVAFSHFESDECGSLNEWLAVAPRAEAACSFVGAMTSVNDFASRPARVLKDGDVLATGKRRLRFLQTPHVPHGWDAGLLFEESDRTLFCSDLLIQAGERPAICESDVVPLCEQALAAFQKSPFANYLPYGQSTHAT